MDSAALSVPCLRLPQHVCRGGRVLEYELNLCTDANDIQRAAWGGLAPRWCCALFSTTLEHVSYLLLLYGVQTPLVNMAAGSCKRRRCGKQSDHAYRTAPHLLYLLPASVILSAHTSGVHRSRRDGFRCRRRARKMPRSSPLPTASPGVPSHSAAGSGADCVGRGGKIRERWRRRARGCVGGMFIRFLF